VFTPHYHGTGHTFIRALLHKPYKFLGKTIFEKADKIVCVSNYEKSLIANRFKVDEEKIVVIPNGVNLEEFRVLKRTKKKNYKTILCVGRLEKYKGIQYLIEVLPLLENDVVLEVVGKGPYKENLVKLAKKLNVTEHVKFFQELPRSKLLQKYADSDLFVLLSRYEAYGISVAEALASGIPCIVAKTSALQEWIDNRNCFGINYPVNIYELADLINKVMGRSVENIKLPDWYEVVKRLLEIY
jgi:glycosyltransferase involved in cell wall biosynthesis